MRKILAATAASLGLVLLLAGCVPPEADPDAEETGPQIDLATMVDPTWSLEGLPIGSVAVGDGYGATYMESNAGDLAIAVFNAETGAPVWQDSASPGAVTPGIQITANLVEFEGASYVTYLKPRGESQWQELVVANIATGEKMRLANPSYPADELTRVWANSRPTECADGKDVCFLGYLRETEDQTAFRAVLGNAVVVPDPDLTLSASSRMLGDRVYSTNSRPPAGTELLGYGAGGATVWEKPYTEVFGAGYSSDAGWAWYDGGEGDVIMGYGSDFAAPSDAYPKTFSMLGNSFVGLDRATGETVWTVPEFYPSCAATSGSFSYDDEIIAGCRIIAGEQVVADAASEAVMTGLEMEIVGVNVTTGEIEWTIAGAGDTSNYFAASGAFAGSGKIRAMLLDGEVALVDLADGTSSPLPDDAQMACSYDRGDFTTAAITAGEAKDQPFSSGERQVPCGADRALSEGQQFSVGALELSAVDAENGFGIISGPNGLYGYALAG